MVQLRDADYSKHFLACAGQARRCAALMSSEQVRRILLQIAQSYEELARTTEASEVRKSYDEPMLAALRKPVGPGAV